MISNMMYFNTQDNDVHEVFKFIGEAFLTHAFVIERENGTFKGYNCSVKKENNKIIIEPESRLIDKIHVNIKGEKQVRIKSICGEKDYTTSGMQWLKVF